MDKTSYMRHNAEYIQEQAPDRERIAHDKKNENNYKFLYQDDIPHGKILDQHKLVNCVDIGSGTGWFANYLIEKRKYKKVYAIEPSKAAQEIAINLYPRQQNVEWINGFAEEEIPKLKLKQKTLFSTMCVLAHINNETTSRVLAALNSAAPSASVLSCSEPWGPPYEGPCWYIRDSAWWTQHLPGWKFTFHTDCKLTDPPGRHKGFTAIKS